MRHVLWVLGMAMAVRSASGLEQIVLIDTDVYEMKDNGHPESHHHFSFQNRPPNNDFRPYKPMTEGTWHIRLSILERPSTERVRIQPFLDDGKAWGHRGLGVRPLTDYPVVFEFVNTGYGEWPNATPIDWSNPPPGVDVFLQTADPTATVNKCGFDGQCWNVMYTDTEVWPYRMRMTVTLVPPGGTYDDTGHPGSVVSTVVTRRARPVSSARAAL